MACGLCEETKLTPLERKVVATAEAYIAKRDPGFVKTGKKVRVEVIRGNWEVTYDLPPHTFDMIPVVVIDAKTGKVIGWRVNQ